MKKLLVKSEPAYDLGKIVQYGNGVLKLIYKNVRNVIHLSRENRKPLGSIYLYWKNAQLRSYHIACKSVPIPIV